MTNAILIVLVVLITIGELALLVAISPRGSWPDRIGYTAYCRYCQWREHLRDRKRFPRV